MIVFLFFFKRKKNEKLKNVVLYFKKSEVPQEFKDILKIYVRYKKLRTPALTGRCEAGLVI